MELNIDRKVRIYVVIAIIITIILGTFSHFTLMSESGCGAGVSLAVIFFIILGIWLTASYNIVNIREKSIILTLNNIGLFATILLPAFLLLMGFLSRYDPGYRITKLMPKFYCVFIILIAAFALMKAYINKDYRFIKESIMIVIIGTILLYLMTLLFY